MNKFILVDGNAILHRAYHALPPLTSKKGEIVNAVYGFFSMFLKILGDFKPSHVAVCFDKAAPTFRKQLYVGYQAQRPKMAENLSPQIDILHKALERMNVQIFEIDGYEADDLIGTLVHQAQNLKLKNQNHSSKLKTQKSKGSKDTSDGGRSDVEIIIVSGDRDLLQLVNSHVRMLAPVTGITNMILYNSQKVEEKFGIKSSQIVDYKALTGDASDNYPGVPGVGPKTASALLKEYGTLEEIYKHLDDLKGKNANLALKLAEGAESAGLAKKLATIVTDAPITLDIGKCDVSHFKFAELAKVFEELGFKSLLKRLENDSDAELEKKKEEKRNEQLGLL